MAITFRAVSPLGLSGLPSTTIPVPVGTTSGDIMVAAISGRGNGIVLTPPAGWTLIERVDENTHMFIATFWKQWTSGDTSFTWTFDKNVNSASFIISYSGVFASAPIDAFGTTTTSTNTLAVSGPSVTTNYSNDMLLAISVSEASGQTFGGPSGYTFRAVTDAHGTFNNSGCSIEVEELQFGGPGPTAAWTSTQINAAHSFGTTIALRDGSARFRLLASTGVGI